MGTPTSTRPAARSRRPLTLLVALTLALGGLSGIGARPAAAQADGDQITQREFDRLTRAAQKNSILFGPEDGTLSLDDAGGESIAADVETENFYARAEFTNPSDEDETPWDYGFTFRSQSRNDFLALLLLGDGSWGVVGPTDVGEDGLIMSGSVDTINGGAGDTNVIDLYADGDVGHVGFNGDYVATFELPVDGAGDILIGSGLLNSDGQPNDETGYTGFIVWTLDEGAIGSGGDLSDDDLTATAEAEDEDATADAEDEDATATAEAEGGDLSDDDLTATADAEDEDATATAEAEDEDATATAEADQGGRETPQSGGDEPTYTSPTFGYTVSYGAPWELVTESSEDDVDTLEIETGASNLQLFATASRATTAECLDTIIATLEDNPAVTDVAVAQDTDDRDLRSDSDELSWVVIFATTEDSGDTAEVTVYYECRVIVEGESLLTITHSALSDDYNDEIENRTDVLDTIELVGGSSTGQDGELSDDDLTATATAEAEETATAKAQRNETPTEEATAESTVPEGSVAILLEAVGASNVTGLGLIEPSEGGSKVTLLAFGASGFVTIHTGSCRNPDETPAFEVGQLDTSGAVEAEVDASVEELTNGDYVMILSDDGTTDAILACGDLSALAG